jgi:release factor glutamine methyltransferase
VISQWSQTLEMQVLLAHITGRNRAWVLAHPEASLTPEQETAFLTAKNQFETGIPLPYLLGHWEFYGLDFWVTPDVLIPRPETELLIDLARTHLRPDSRLIEIGTGSGCLPITLATLLPKVEIVATDISAAALALARLNAEKHQVKDRITFLEADLFPTDLPLSTFDLILSNPPYIPTATLHGLTVFGREPGLALDGGPDGLTTIRRLLGQSQRWLAAGGVILVEVESGLGAAAHSMAKVQFPAAQVQILPDLAGLDRVLAIVT